MAHDRTIDSLQAGELLDVLVDDYGFTGEGFVRLEDGWLSVRGALPGERVRVEVEPAPAWRTRRRWARLVEVLRASDARQDPLCELDPVCRGCQLRHMTVRAESEYKARTIREVLERHAQIPVEAQPEIELLSPQPWMRGDAHRIRTAMTYRRTPQGWELGLRSPDTPELVPMAGCAALVVPARRIVGHIERSLDMLSERGALPASRPGRGEELEGGGAALDLIRVASPVHGRGFVELVFTDGELDEPAEALLGLLEGELPEQIGIFVTRAGSTDHVAGPETLRLPVTELVIEVDARDWFHATMGPADLLYDRVMGRLTPGPGDRFLDVGCGVGTIALLAAKLGAEAVGVDINPASIARAELNAIHNDLDRASFVPGSWEAALRRLMLEGERFDLATINPMREPLGQRPLAYLDALGVEQLVYLGPSPASAARDIGELGQMGWRLDWLGAAMLHPATYHVMLAAHLSRG